MPMGDFIDSRITSNPIKTYYKIGNKIYQYAKNIGAEYDVSPECAHRWIKNGATSKGETVRKITIETEEYNRLFGE